MYWNWAGKAKIGPNRKNSAPTWEISLQLGYGLLLPTPEVSR